MDTEGGHRDVKTNKVLAKKCQPWPGLPKVKCPSSWESDIKELGSPGRWRERAMVSGKPEVGWVRPGLFKTLCKHTVIAFKKR